MRPPPPATRLLPRAPKAEERSQPDATFVFGEPAATGAGPRRRAPPEATTILADFHVTTLELQEQIGRGGMGEVWRAWDPQLSRTVAVKVLRGDLPGQDALTEAFVAEARATAVLQHPGIVPVHGIYRLEDGRPCYAMREVEGRTLREAILHLHEDRSLDGAELVAGLHRLVRVFEQVCQTMAYAHARQVIHRDIKPQNVMLGPFGEVYVLDWGLARSLVAAPAALDGRPPEPAWLSSDSAVAGTPAYMAPEQAWPGLADLSPATDVYALGAVLYEILAGRPPVRALGADPLLNRVAMGRVDPLPNHPAVTPELARICKQALQRHPEDRYADAGALAAALAAWIEGENRRTEAMAAIREADVITPRIEQLRAEAHHLAATAGARLAAIAPTEPIEARRAVWELEDEAGRLRREAEVLTARSLQHLHAALAAVPDLPEAVNRLADHHRSELVEARRRRDSAAEAREDALLRHYDRGRHAAWLAGAGALTLLTDPPGADVELHRFVTDGRRLETRLERSLGRTPLRAVDVPPGSWLLVLRVAGRPAVRYPIEVGGAELWTGVPPGATEPYPVPIPTEADYPPAAAYIPAGPAQLGGDPRATPQRSGERVWLPGFFLQREPIINQDWLAVLNELAATGRADEAAALVPVAGGALYDWSPELPVRMVDVRGAEAFATWRASRDRVAWRLPGEHEWEKAARGVDGRAFPWGDFLDPYWCNMREGHLGTPTVAPVRAFPGDVSVYGVRGLGGNVRCWCADAGPLLGTRVVRGGSFLASADDCRSGSRASLRADSRDPGTGVRLAVDAPR